MVAPEIHFTFPFVSLPISRKPEASGHFGVNDTLQARLHGWERLTDSRLTGHLGYKGFNEGHPVSRPLHLTLSLNERFAGARRCSGEGFAIVVKTDFDKNIGHVELMRAALQPAYQYLGTTGSRAGA